MEVFSPTVTGGLVLRPTSGGCVSKVQLIELVSKECSSCIYANVLRSPYRTHGFHRGLKSVNRSLVAKQVTSATAWNVMQSTRMSLLEENPVINPPAHPTYDLLKVIRLALSEDAGDRGDVTCLATIAPETRAEARFLAKADGIIAGVTMGTMVFHEVDPELVVSWTCRDGDAIAKGQEFGSVQGRARSILVAERVVLNFMQRMSGVATATHAMVERAKPARVLETRKTVPGLRLVDKWAVLIGGGENHRMGLFDMVMIKDNHIAAAGGIQQAVEATRDYLCSNGLDMPVEVEARTLEEVSEVLACAGSGQGRVTRIMLDNMVVPVPGGGVDVSMLEQAVALVGSRLETEASGNVTLDTVQAIGATGVTFISSGALTHSVKALDISLNINTELALAVGKRTMRA